MNGPWFIGVDLAWSDRNTSGVAVLTRGSRGLELVSTAAVGPVADVAALIRPLRGDWYIAVDAPLVVRNRTGRRPSDAAISALYGRFEAGAHPTNLTILRGKVRGAELARALGPHGARILDTLPPRLPRGRWLWESYPHAGMVELFGLDKTIKYKRGAAADRRAGLEQLVGCFRRRLPVLDPPLCLTPPLRALLGQDRERLTGRRLKAHEDQLDAVFCAYMAAHAARWGRARSRLLGDARTGAVIVPRVRTDLP